MKLDKCTQCFSWTAFYFSSYRMKFSNHFALTIAMAVQTKKSSDGTTRPKAMRINQVTRPVLGTANLATECVSASPMPSTNNLPASFHAPKPIRYMNPYHAQASKE